MSDTATTTSDKIAAAFIGFFTFIGASMGVLLIAFILTTFTQVKGRAAPWLQPFLKPIVFAAPVVGIAVGAYVGWRYLLSRRAKQQNLNS